MRFDPALLFQPVQRRVERTLLYVEHFARDLLDPLGDRPAVQRLGRYRFQNQEIQSPLDQIARFPHCPTPLLLPSHDTSLPRALPINPASITQLPRSVPHREHSSITTSIPPFSHQPHTKTIYNTTSIVDSQGVFL